MRNKQVGLLTMFALMLATIAVQAQDSVFRLKSAGGSSKVNGKITDISPDGVKVGGKLVPAQEIRRLAFNKEPSEINRARDRMESGQFNDAIEELGKMKSPPRSKELQAEVDFIKAYSTAQISLRGGSVTPQAAGSAIRGFISKHPNSLHLYPATEQYGKLIFAFGKPDAAITEFQKLTSAQWLEYRLKGHFYKGLMALELGKFGEASSAFNAIQSEPSNDDIAQSYKLLAQCGLARAKGLQGDVNGAKQMLDGMIKSESSDKNKQLFAYIYNSLGAIYQKAGRNKEASRAFLRTHLLYNSELEAHAESLYHLARLWPKLEDNDRAASAREILKTRYRNSYWAGKL